MGRYKLGPQGTYYDPNDSGPNQASPDQIQQFQQTQQPVQPNMGYQPPTGGINPPRIPGDNQGPIARGPSIPGMPPWMRNNPYAGIPFEKWFDPNFRPDLRTQSTNPNLPNYVDPRIPMTFGNPMSQGGGMNDPRWTNGTWGGGTLSTIGSLFK